MITLTLVLFCLLQHNVMVRFSQNALREISDEIRKETGPKRVDRLPPQCIICFDFVDSAWICLENCGHYACKACLLHQVSFIADSFTLVISDLLWLKAVSDIFFVESTGFPNEMRTVLQGARVERHNG